jgi:hypothetical protein
VGHPPANLCPRLHGRNDGSRRDGELDPFRIDPLVDVEVDALLLDYVTGAPETLSR